MHDEALAKYRLVAARVPGHTAALTGAGNALMARKRYDEAIDIYRRVLDAEPDNGIVHHNLAEAYQNQSRVTEAEAAYREAVRLCPGRVEPLVNLGRALQRQGRLAEALACHERALGLDPRHGAAYHNIALCRYDDRDLEPALSAFRKAVDLDTANALARCFLGILYLQKGEEARAEAYLEFAQQSPFTASIVESYRYGAKLAPRARWFSTTSQVLSNAIDSANPAGLFLEFGACFGASITLIAQRTGATVHGFDSIEGLPESWETGSGESLAREGAGTYTTKGMLPPVPANVALHVGVFEDRLPGFAASHPGPVSFIKMDCDLYSSTNTVFRHLGDRLVPGSVIVFDEYFCYPEWRRHEYKAFQEFVGAQGVSYEYLAFSFFTGQAVVRITEVGRPVRR